MQRALVAGLILMLAGPGFAREPLRPAELPPADYAGQQYVDSNGCMFVRAGRSGEVVWVPRVSREGVPVCGNPPSGGRVPVAEETGAEPYAPGEATGTAPKAATVAEPAPAATGTYFVAVGSFGIASNTDRAEARLRALGYSVVRGRVQGGSSTLTTVFAGPFADAAAAAAARAAILDNGFPDAVVMGP
jgi:cell division septation protein DedD